MIDRFETHNRPLCIYLPNVDKDRITYIPTRQNNKSLRKEYGEETNTRSC